MSDTLYTVVSRHGEATDTGLTVAQAADSVMTYDGNRWDIRPEYKSGHASFPDLESALAYQAKQVGDSDPEDQDAVREAYEPRVDCWRLYVSWRGGGGVPPESPSVIFSLADSADLARDEIFQEVIDHAGRWSGQEVMTDAEWSARVADMASDGEESA